MRFEVNLRATVTATIFVEADDLDEAREKAKGIGETHARHPHMWSPPCNVEAE